MSVSNIVMNSRMAHYGDMLVAGFGVAGKVTIIPGMICIGLGQGVQPLLDYSVGAKNKERYRRCLRFSLLFSFAISTVMTILCYIFIERIVGSFLTDETALAFGVLYYRIVLSTSFLFGIYYVLVNALQTMGKAEGVAPCQHLASGPRVHPRILCARSLLRREGHTPCTARGRRRVHRSCSRTVPKVLAASLRQW